MSVARLLVLLGCVAWPLTARAQGSDAEQGAVARSLFHEGVALMGEQQWDEAADRFRRTMALRPTPVVIFNLASALGHAGSVVESAELLRGVVRNPSAPDDIRASARSLLDEVAPRVASLTIRVEGEGAHEAQVTVDGLEISRVRVGVAAPIDPGHHVLTTTRGDEVLDRGEVDLPDGGSAEITLQAPAPVAAEVPTPRETARAAPQTMAAGAPAARGSSSVFSRWWFWAGVGVVLAGAVAAILVLTRDRTPDPIQGDLDPPVLRGMPLP